MKFTLYFSLVFFILQMSVAAMPQTTEHATQPVTGLVMSGQSGLGFQFNCPVPDFHTIKTNHGTYTGLTAAGLLPAGIPGEPELPSFFRFFEIPEGATVRIETEVIEELTYPIPPTLEDYPLFPHQPPAVKQPDSVRQILFTAEAYSVGSYRHSALAEVEDLGIMRSMRLGLLKVSPYAYLPASHSIRAAHKISVKIVFDFPAEASPAPSLSRHASPYFSIPASMLLGGKMAPPVDSLAGNPPVKYVIVAHAMFRDSLQDFIAWKTRKGFNVIEAYTDDPQVGSSTTSIRNYLTGLYQNATVQDPAPTYLLIVGDVGQIPAFSGTTGSHVTDLYYAEYTGDNLPELYYGRFSANNVSQLMPQIEKTLRYEQYLIPNPAFLNEVVMIAGVDSYYAPTHANGQINYGTSAYFNAAHGITSHTYLYPASGSADAQIIANVSAGVGYVNYTAHGGTGGWSDPTFNTTHVGTLANLDEYPLMVGNCCLTNSFQIASCFGEALLRAEGKGAIGYIGASNNSYWNEDFWWGVGLGTITANPTYAATGLGMYDRLWHDHGEAFSEWYVSQGRMVQAGNLAVQASSSSLKKYYWETYHLMGDPSLMPYLGQPAPFSLSLPAFLMPTATQVDIQAEPYAYVAISRGGVLHGAAQANASGLASVNILPFQTPGSAEVVITGQNRQPFFGNILVVSPAGAYPYLDQLLIVDTAGNGNGQADYAEVVHFQAVLTNGGAQAADSVVVLLRCNDPYIRLTDSTAFLSSLPGVQQDTLDDSFCIRIDSLISDQHAFTLEFTVFYNNDTATFTRVITAQAPTLQLQGSLATEVIGNGNGTPEPGETVDLAVTIVNDGHSSALDLNASIQALTPFILVPDTISTSAACQPGQQISFHLPLQIIPNSPQGMEVLLLLRIDAASGIRLEDTLRFRAGQAPVVVIDLDPNNSSAPALVQAVKANGFGCDLVTSIPSGINSYEAAFVCLGIYSDNHQLSASEGQLLASYLNNGGQLYMEGGDTWYYDTKTAVHPYFNITGVADGSDDLGILLGASSAFTSGMSFTYTGENNWIDRLAPAGSAFAIMNNSNPSYTAGVAYDGGSYRTVGLSFEFGGLTDGSSPSTRNDLMAAILGFFQLPVGPLTAGFVPASPNACEGMPVMFTDTSTGPVNGWFWTFGEGIPDWSTQQHPTAMWAQAGLYEVSLSVTDGFRYARTDPALTFSILAPPMVTKHPSDTLVIAGSSLQLQAAGINYSSIHWECSADSGLTWNTLTDGPLYAGTTTSLLQILGTDASMDGQLYRCVFTGACPAESPSHPARLMVDVPSGHAYCIIDSLTTCVGLIQVPLICKDLYWAMDLDLKVLFDANTLTWGGYSWSHPGLTAGALQVLAGPGTLQIEWNGTAPLNLPDDTLLVLSFIANYGTPVVAFDTSAPSNNRIMDISGNPIQLTLEAGGLEIRICSGIYGKAYYANDDSTAMAGLSLTAQGLFPKTSLTDSQGRFFLPVEIPGYYDLMPSINAPVGGINATDALAALKHFAGLDTLSGLSLRAADVNLSGYVNASDALSIASYFVGIISAFAAPAWQFDEHHLYYDGNGALQQDVAFLCTGDVDRSFLEGSKSGTAAIRFEGRLPYEAGKTLRLPLYLESTGPLSALSLELEWPEGWEIRNATAIPGYDDFRYLAQRNRIRLSWISLAPLSVNPGEPFLWIEVLPSHNPAPPIVNLIECADRQGCVIPDARLSMPLPEQQAIFLTVGLPYPQPLRSGVFSLPVHAPTSTRLELEIFDQMGRKVFHQEMNVMEGPQDMVIQCALPSGSYFLELTHPQQGETRIARKLIIL